ncbi:MAG: hypothetical protein LBN74_01900 [Prevotella sp.]|jgi:hypothetical protein|nr:hypothetical protein [Prevotella sp.]
MRNLVFILLFIISATAYSQTEIPKDSLSILNRKPLKFDEKLDNYINFDISGNKVSSTKHNSYEPLQKEDVKPIELNLPPLDIYTGPPVESNTFTRYPFANDYRYDSGMSLGDGAWLSSASIQSTYPLIGASRTVSVRFNYQPSDRFIFSGGPYVAKNVLYGAHYNNKNVLYGTQYNDMGVTGSAKFILTDRVRINAYGQYSAYGKDHGVGPYMSGMYPQTYYGGTIEVKITDKFGIEGGVIRELNPFNGKWENRPYFSPVFYSK